MSDNGNLHLQASKPVGNPNWKKGVSGNPRGRPVASRQKIAEGILSDMAELWGKRSAEAPWIVCAES